MRALGTALELVGAESFEIALRHILDAMGFPPICTMARNVCARRSHLKLSRQLLAPFPSAR